MRPSLVRSNSAPHSSSSSTRSGDSCACSCAMRQLLRSLPPRMVSRKWTFQLSSFHTFASAAVEAVEVAAHEVAQRVAARRIAREQDHVGEHEDRTQADAEVPAEVERVEGVSPQEDEQRGREDQRVAVQVLDEERKARLTG